MMSWTCKRCGALNSDLSNECVACVRERAVRSWWW